MLVEQNDILQTCRLVTLGRGTAVDVPVIRRCPTCGELTSREGDLNSCKMKHMAHYGGECEMAQRQSIDLPEGVARAHRHMPPLPSVSANRRQVTYRGCSQTIDVRSV
ncbi:hypothetical protein J8273_7196 [Carpediemonas membranifera]|uniref:Uncharacterized protein n=1 Tax=Carpediemonas membranifera TaxID=201153 RepID=A0A8J6AQE0_9EUKA|nr:hypothetical protein J8273_7196 [Carpediemonas membranifera]|eukprot:KAG9390928.1 hypothetical protein J8273_7196 [Carpediemonas membranifera]